MCAMKRLILRRRLVHHLGHGPGGHTNARCHGSGAAVRVGARSADAAAGHSFRRDRRRGGQLEGPHLRLLARQRRPGRPTWPPAAQLLEFDPKGKFVREIGKNNFALGLRARGAHRQAGQHLDRRQGLEHDPEDEPAGPRRVGVRTQGRVVAPRRAARLRVAAERHPGARRRRDHAPAEQQPAQPAAGASRQRVQPADRRGVGLAGQFVLQRRLRQFARRQGECEGRVGRQLGIARQRSGAVRHAARHRGGAEGRNLRRRSRQPPHPGARHHRQVPSRVHDRRAGRYQARQDRLRRRGARTPRPVRWRPARPTRCA